VNFLHFTFLVQVHGSTNSIHQTESQSLVFTTTERINCIKGYARFLIKMVKRQEVSDYFL